VALGEGQTLGVCAAAPGERPPVIDVHMHAIATPPDLVIAELDAQNVVAVVLSSLALPRTREWAARDPRFMPSLAFREAVCPTCRPFTFAWAIPFCSKRCWSGGPRSATRRLPREQFHEYLRALMRANLGDRLMFGSDAAGPGAVAPSIDGITSAAFLSDGQRRAILCDNAARFFRLTTRPGG
jgi:hypothetical protein